jgi:hypothetical protein
MQLRIAHGNCLKATLQEEQDADSYEEEIIVLQASRVRVPIVSYGTDRPELSEH